MIHRKTEKVVATNIPRFTPKDTQKVNNITVTTSTP